jgi:hypothetical protein
VTRLAELAAGIQEVAARRIATGPLVYFSDD